MGTHYSQLCLTERIEIYRLRGERRSLRAIASALALSTISREIHRNSKPTKAWSGGYRPERADALAARRRRWDYRFKRANRTCEDGSATALRWDGRRNRSPAG